MIFNGKTQNDRVGIKSLVLEASASLRTTGFAFTAWTNAWKALDEVGIGDFLRQQHERIYGLIFILTTLINFRAYFFLFNLLSSFKFHVLGL